MFFPTPDVIGKVAAGKLLQPLNKRTSRTSTNVWESLQDPFYDKGGVYSVPYTLFTTGIGYRIDAVAKAPDAYDNPYDIFWDPANSGQVYLLEDDREVFGMALLRREPDDRRQHRGRRADRRRARRRERAHRPRQREGRRRGLHRAAREAGLGAPGWSGDVVNAQYYLPEGETIDNIGYWYPADGGGMIGSDTIAVMRGAEQPVLAHTFLNYLLDETHALENYGWLGYQPPQNVARPRLGRRRRVRAGAPRVGGHPARGLRHAASSCSS